MTALFQLTLREAHEKLKNKEITSRALTQAFFDRIQNTDEKVDAYLSLHKDAALERAQAIDKEGNFLNPLAGIPFANKPIIQVKGEECNAASKILEGFTPVENATVIEKLFSAGAISLGNANMDEFAQGSSTENSAYKKTKNPWDLSRVPGGSSGGSAAAVASDECIFALGTDTGGSIRQPAAFCGCVGLKVSYGRVSRSGVMAYASSFDTIGPLTKTVEDAALVLEAIAGNDPKDFTTPKMEVPKYSEHLDAPMKGKTIVFIKEFFESESLDPNIKAATKDILEKLEKEGAVIREVSIPELNYAIATYYLLVKSEGSTNLHRYDGIRYGHATNKAKTIDEVFELSRSEGFGSEVKRCIMLGTYTLSAGYYDAYYLKAAKVRRLIKQGFEKVFAECDAIIAPVSPFMPFQIEEKAEDPLAMYLADIYTVPANLAGIPSLSLPIAITNGLPIGIQIMGKQFDELGILQIGKYIENMVQFKRLQF